MGEMRNFMWKGKTDGEARSVCGEQISSSDKILDLLCRQFGINLRYMYVKVT